MAKNRRTSRMTPSFEPAEDLSAPESYPPDHSSDEMVAVHTPYGLVYMPPEKAAAYSEQEDVDDLARAFDADFAPHKGADDTLSVLLMQKGKESQKMNPSDMSQLSPEMVDILTEMMQDGSLASLFQPYQQEQNVLDQRMAMATQQRQPNGKQHSSTAGAIFGGLSDALGNMVGANMQQQALKGQTDLGQRMQSDAVSRLQAMLKKKGADPTTGLMAPAVDDAELAALMAGG